MRYTKIRLKNICSFDDVTVDISALPGLLVGITGANGSGKTVMLESLVAATTKRRKLATRGTFDELFDVAVKRGANKANGSLVEVGFVGTDGRRLTARHNISEGTSEVLDEHGTPLLPAAKKTEFDAWAQKHLLSPEVVASTLMAVQGQAGLAALEPGPRKAVLLRAIGCEHYEELSKLARARTSYCKVQLEVLRPQYQSAQDAVDELAEERALDAEAAAEAAAAALASARETAGLFDEAARAATELDRLERMLREADGDWSLVEKGAMLREAAAEITRLTSEKNELLRAFDRAAADAKSRRETLERAAAARKAAEQRVESMRDVLTRVDAIKAAHAERSALEGKLAKMRDAYASAQLAKREADAELVRARRDQGEAVLRRERHGRECEAAQKTVHALREAIAADTKSLKVSEGLVKHHGQAIEAVDAAIVEASARLDAIRASTIPRLREPLQEIADGAPGPAGIARAALTRDDEEKQSEGELPAELSRLKVDARDHRHQQDLAWNEARRLKAAIATSERELSATETQWAAADEGWREAQKETSRLNADVKRLEAWVGESAARSQSLAAEGAELRARFDELRPLADLHHTAMVALESIAEAERVASDARVAEERAAGYQDETPAAMAALNRVAEQIQAAIDRTGCGSEYDVHDAVDRLGRLESKRDAFLAMEASARPRIEELKAVVALGEGLTRADLALLAANHEQAQERVTEARMQAKASQDSAYRAAVLATEIKIIEDDMAEWAKLGLDFGRNGLQALEIDAAGPRITTLANDLLHTCHGPRWSVEVVTSKLDATGKRELEVCDIVVTDSEKGETKLIERLSGGELVFVGDAVSLALTEVACKNGGMERPTLIRDESGAALHPTMMSAWVAMLRRAAQQMNADKVLVVSHSEAVQDMMDSLLDVSALSRIEY